MSETRWRLLRLVFRKKICLRFSESFMAKIQYNIHNVAIKHSLLNKYVLASFSTIATLHIRLDQTVG